LLSKILEKVVKYDKHTFLARNPVIYDLFALKMPFYEKSSHFLHVYNKIGNILAHAFYPTSGGVHFDEDETWLAETKDQNDQYGTNLFFVATHELGRKNLLFNIHLL